MAMLLQRPHSMTNNIPVIISPSLLPTTHNSPPQSSTQHDCIIFLLHTNLCKHNNRNKICAKRIGFNSTNRIASYSPYKLAQGHRNLETDNIKCTPCYLSMLLGNSTIILFFLYQMLFEFRLYYKCGWIYDDMAGGKMIISHLAPKRLTNLYEW